MKKSMATNWVRQMPCPAVLTAVLLGSLAASGANYSIVNETYDPPTLTDLGSWEWGDINSLSRDYVSAGVGGSTAVQVVVEFGGADLGQVATRLVQSGVMGGNEWSTRENTVLSFDLKIDRPGVKYVGLYFDAWDEYVWNFGALGPSYTSELGDISTGSYKPGVFKKMVVPLNDPRLHQNPFPDPDNMPPLFNASARTYNNVTLVIDSWNLEDTGPFVVTVDNVQITTKTEMVPFKGSGAGEIAFDETVGFIVTERGSAEHIGSYVISYTLPFVGLGTALVKAANGDTMSGFIYFGEFDYGVEILTGTGRFEGVVGSFHGKLGPGPTEESYTSEFSGALSRVGWNKE
jgi:hypothetical protein